MATDGPGAALSANGVGSTLTLEIGSGLYPGHADRMVDRPRRQQARWDLHA
jgi:hypothetical protein